MRSKLMKRKEPRREPFLSVRGRDSLRRNGCYHGSADILCVINNLLLASCGIFLFLFVSNEAGAADLLCEVPKQNICQSVDSFPRPYDAAQARWFTGAETPLPDVEADAAAANSDTRAQALSSDEIEERREPLIEQSDMQRGMGIPLVFNDAVDHYIRYFTTAKRDLFKKWLRRKRRYAPLMKEILREHGLPEDLVYLAMIESGFNVKAYSPAKAAGPWQFIQETGRRYGLAVNYWVDERRHIEKSTVAAARYLQELFDQFGCWYLAAAGYNAGENKIARLVKRHRTKDFWQLRAYNTLPRETREYVPQLIAAAIIAKDPEKYGLGESEATASYEPVKEIISGGIPLKAVAKAASAKLTSIRTLNPELRRGITPPGKNYRVALPPKTNPVAFRSSLASIMKNGRKVVGVTPHLTKRRDSLRKITRRYCVSKEDLILVNSGPIRLKKGRLVYIPLFDRVEEEKIDTRAKTADFREKMIRRSARDKARKGVVVTFVSSVRKATQKRPRKFHRVRRGDTLIGIAGKYGRSVQDIKKMNHLKSNRIRKGLLLRVSSAETMVRPSVV